MISVGSVAPTDWLMLSSTKEKKRAERSVLRVQGSRPLLFPEPTSLAPVRAAEDWLECTEDRPSHVPE